MTLRITTLPNGFRIVTESMPGLLSASAGIWVMAGGRHERAEQNGIAHFLEHMAFKGTKRRSALQIAEEIEDVGGYINAYTSREMTAYYARILKDDVALALDVIGDIVLNPAFDPKEIEVERHVILQEIGQALDTPDDIIFDWLQEVSYPDQSFGRTILGPAENVSGFARADLQAFVKDNYGPAQMILSAAGGVDHVSDTAPPALTRMAIAAVFDETDWWPLQRTLTSLPRLFQLWVAKHVNRIAGTMSFLSHQDGRCDRCPSCETCVETCPHIARCPEAGRASAFAQSTDELELWLGANKTHPDLQSLLLSYTRGRGTVTCLECAISLDLPPILHNLARSQDVIEWELYMMGMLSTQTVTVQSAYSCSTNRHVQF